MNDITVWCQNASVTEPQRELFLPQQTPTAAQTASPKNGTSKPVPYKRTSTAKHPSAVILSVLSEMREKGFANQKTESPRRISRRSMFAQTRVLLWRLCIRNSSFARREPLVSVYRSLRRKQLDFLLLTSFDCKKLRVLRGLLAILLSDDTGGAHCVSETNAYRLSCGFYPS